MSEASVVTKSRGGRPVYRLLRFGSGLAVGAVLFLALLFLGFTFYSDRRSGDVDLATSGGDISTAGGAKLAIRRNSGVIIQVCNGRCDDLRVTNRGRSNGLEDVRVLDSQGRCIACIQHHAAVYSGRRDDWKIAGPAPLRITRTNRPVEAHD